MTRKKFSAAFSLLFVSGSNGFHMPSPSLAKHLLTSRPPILTTQIQSLLNDGSPMTTVDGEARWVSMPMESNVWMADGGALDTVKNIALGITAILFLLAGLTYLYASFIIPVAAQELEKECKELDPQLWEEYQGKLGEGETMATRPDLMQELGMKLQPLLEAKLAAMEKDGKESGSMPTALETTMNPMGSAPAKTDVVDVPVIETTSPDQWDSNDDVKPKK